jgi:N-acyl-D-amino-acid deacylase
MLDIKIINGRVLDPELKTLRPLELGIIDGKIAEIGREAAPAERIIDAAGHIVSPGFIDIHMHEEDYSLTKMQGYDIAEAMLNMGVTTAVIGNCGNNRQDICDVEYFIENHGNPVNYMSYIGHNFLRHKVGNSDTLKESSREQIRRMSELVEAAVDAGAIGVSYGL